MTEEKKMLRCPRCDCEGPFKVIGTTELQLTKDVEMIVADAPIYDDSCICKCPGCRLHMPLKEFKLPAVEGDDDEPNTAEYWKNRFEKMTEARNVLCEAATRTAERFNVMEQELQRKGDVIGAMNKRVIDLERWLNESRKKAENLLREYVHWYCFTKIPQWLGEGLEASMVENLRFFLKEDKKEG